MIRTIGYIAVCVAALSWTTILGQSIKTSYPQPNDGVYVTEDFGDCTFAKGKDRSEYVQPYVTCISGIEKFILAPQKDTRWGLAVTSGDETNRSEEEQRSSMLNVIIRVDTNAPHHFSMIWPKNMNMALGSVELRDLMPLLDELRRANSMTISRNDEVIEFDLSRANQAFTELVFEQSVALTRVEKAASE